MMRVAQKGTTIVPVEVVKSTPKAIRGGAPQYLAWRVGSLVGGGDTIEEAVDELSEKL